MSFAWQTRVYKVGGPWAQVGYNLESIYFGLQTRSHDIRTGWRRIRRLDLHAKPSSSLGPLARSGRPTGRSAGLLTGRPHLSGAAGSLVGGDPWGTLIPQAPERRVGEAGLEGVMTKLE